MERGFNTRAKMDEAHHQLVQAEEDLRNAEAEAAEDRARLQSGTTTAGVNPVIAAAIAARDQAELNLARTEVRAPVDGIVTQASRLQLGQMAIEGRSEEHTSELQSLMRISYAVFCLKKKKKKKTRQ